MKKMILSAALCGGVLLASAATMTVAHAADLTGTTTVNSEVIKGDISLVVDENVDFGKANLASTVTFAAQDINFNVKDYTGNTDGYKVSAKLADTDAKRSLKFGTVELSDAAQVISAPTSNVIGENPDKTSAVLSYTGITEAKKYASSVEWSVEPTTALLAE